jgi:cyclic lactone autoinducer peptide
MIIVNKIIKAINSTASKSINTTSLGHFYQPKLKVKKNNKN